MNLVWLAVGAPLIPVLYGLLVRSGPRIRDTAFMREYQQLHAIASKLRLHAEANPNSAVGDFAGKGVDELAAAGILSQDDATYIREHRIEYYGFDPKRISGNVAVLQSMCTNGTTRRRIVGYSDGSAVAYNLDAGR